METCPIRCLQNSIFADGKLRSATFPWLEAFRIGVSLRETDSRCGTMQAQRTAAITAKTSFFGTLHAPCSCERVSNHMIPRSLKYTIGSWLRSIFTPALPLLERTVSAALHVASAARSPDCTVALLPLAHASLRLKCCDRVHENGGIDAVERLLKMRCGK